MKTLVGATVGVLLLGSTSAFAVEDVQSLMQLCSPQAPFDMRVACAWYLTGIVEMMSVNAASGLPTLGACRINDVSSAATVQAFLNWAYSHPEQWSVPRSNGALKAIRAAWPCEASHLR